MNGAAQLAIVAGLAEEFLDDLRDEVRATMPKAPEPERIDYALLADFVMSRLEPRLQLLEERAASIDARVALIAQQQTRLRRFKR
jgi:hypothetical protein